MSTYLKSGLHPLNPHSENLNTAINMLGRLTGKITIQYYEPTAKPGTQVLTSEEKTTPVGYGRYLHINPLRGMLAKKKDGI
jgi:hypothetical protein